VITRISRLLFYFILINLHTSLAQQMKEDSLLIAANTTIMDTNKVKSMLELGKHYYNSSKYEQSIRLLEKAVGLGKNLKFNNGIGKAYFHIGRAYKKQYNFEQAILNVRKSIFYLKEFPTIQAVAYEQLADCYYDLGDFKTTESYYDTIVKLATSRKDTAQLLRILTNSGNLFFFKGDFQKSTYNYTKALKIGEAQKDSEVVAANLNNIANSYTELNDYKNAIVSATKAIYLAKSIKDYKKMGIAYDIVASNLVNLKLLDSVEVNYRKSVHFFKIADAKGDLALALKNFADYYYLSFKNAKHTNAKLNANQFLDSAKLKLTQALNYANEASDEYTKASILNSLGYINKDLNNWADAKNNLVQSVHISNSHGFKDLYKKACTELATVLYELNDFKNAYLYADTARMLEDSIMNQEKIKAIGELTIKYESEKKEQQLKLLAKEAEAKALQHAKETQKKQYAYFGIVLLLLVGSYTFWLYTKRKKLSTQLAGSIIQLNEAQAQLIVTEKEKEAASVRLRIAQDIHDDVGSNLTKITMLSQLISEQSNSFSDVKSSAKKLSSYSHQLNQSMSEIIWASDPKNDSLEKFLDYLKQYALNFFADSEVKVTTDFPNVNTALLLNPELKRNLFLIAKEALNNSLKYAEANNVHLGFTINSNQFEFTVSDNGKGFLMDEKKLTGNGIHNITQRVKNIKGKLIYSAQPGAGCRIHIVGELV